LSKLAGANGASQKLEIIASQKSPLKV